MKEFGAALVEFDATTGVHVVSGIRADYEIGGMNCEYVSEAWTHEREVGWGAHNMDRRARVAKRILRAELTKIGFGNTAEDGLGLGSTSRDDAATRKRQEKLITARDETVDRVVEKVVRSSPHSSSRQLFQA